VWRYPRWNASRIFREFSFFFFTKYTHTHTHTHTPTDIPTGRRTETPLRISAPGERAAKEGNCQVHQSAIASTAAAHQSSVEPHFFSLPVIMLSMSFLGVRGLPRPPPGSSLSMAVQHGAQRQWTCSIGMDKSMVSSRLFWCACHPTPLRLIKVFYIIRCPGFFQANLTWPSRRKPPPRRLSLHGGPRLLSLSSNSSQRRGSSIQSVLLPTAPAHTHDVKRVAVCLWVSPHFLMHPWRTLPYPH